jgi:hypothetical protein
VHEEEERLRPIPAEEDLFFRTDDSILGWMSIDDTRMVDGADRRYFFYNSLGYGRLTIGIQLIEVKALRFPVFVEAQAKVKPGLTLKPGDVRDDLVGLRLQVLTVQIESTCIFAFVL